MSELPKTDRKTYATEFFAILTSSRRLTAQLKFVEYSEQLDAIKRLIDETFSDRRVLLLEHEAELEKKNEKLHKAMRILEEQGISLEQLQALQDGNNFAAAERSKITPVEMVKTPDGRMMNPSAKMKYKFPSEDGQDCFWHGKGKVPKRLQDLYDEGRPKSDFRI